MTDMLQLVAALVEPGLAAVDEAALNWGHGRKRSQSHAAAPPGFWPLLTTSNSTPAFRTMS